MELIKWGVTAKGNIQVLIKPNKPVQGLEEKEAIRIIRTLSALSDGVLRRSFERALSNFVQTLNEFVF